MTFIRTGFDKKTTTASRNAKLRDLEARLGLKQNKLEVVHTTAKPWNDLGEEGEMRLQFEDGVLVLYVKTMGHWYSTLLEREYSTQFYNLDGPQSWPAIYNRIQFDMTISASDNIDNSIIAKCPVVLPPHSVIWNIAVGIKAVANGTYKINLTRTTVQEYEIDARGAFESFTDNTCDTNNTAGSGSSFGGNPRIIQCDDTSNIGVGMFVKGTGITGSAIVTQIDSSTLFRIAEDVASTQTNTTLTFYPGVYNTNELVGANDLDTNSTDSSTASDIDAGTTADLNKVWFSPGYQPEAPNSGATANNSIYVLNAGTDNGNTNKTTPAKISVYLEYFGFDFRFSQDQIIAGDFSGSNPNAPIKNSVAESTSTHSGGSGV